MSQQCTYLHEHMYVCMSAYVTRISHTVYRTAFVLGSRLHSGSSTFHSLSHSLSFRYLWLFCQTSSLRWWHSTFHFFFCPSFLTNISRLETTIPTVSSWMSANLLSLNQSKTEFSFIGLPKQLPKVSNPSLLVPSNVTISLSDSTRCHFWLTTYYVWS